MSKVIVSITLSLDGFVNDPNGDIDRLFPDLKALRKTESLQEAIKKTGAVVMGRLTYAMSDDPDWYAYNYEFQVPLFVLTHNAPVMHPKETELLKINFVSDGIERAIEKAKAIAGNKNVIVVGGASTAQQCIDAGLADELHINSMPVLFYGGLKFFENMNSLPFTLKKIKVQESDNGRTESRYRIVKT